MWLVSLFAFTYIFPDTSSIITYKPPPQGEMIYEAWLKQLHAVAPVFRASEDRNVSSLLSNVYYPGYEHTKPTQVRIEKLLVYLPKGQAIGITRVRGRNESGKAEIFHHERSTFLASNLIARAFTEHAHKFEVVKNLDERMWLNAPVDEDVDWYEVVLYFEAVEDADYLMLDTPKYVDAAKREGASVDFALVSAHPIRDIRIWEVIPSQFAQAGEVPLLFKEWNDVPEGSIPQGVGDFNQFLLWLEQQRRSPDNSTDPSFFGKLDKLVQVDSHRDWQIPQLFTGASNLHSSALFHLANVKNSMIFTYQFDQ